MSIPVPRYFHLDLSKLVVRNVSGFCLRAPICVHLFGPICTYLRAPNCTYLHLFACTYFENGGSSVAGCDQCPGGNEHV